jgi:hypothetical protein
MMFPYLDPRFWSEREGVVALTFARLRVVCIVFVNKFSIVSIVFDQHLLVRYLKILPTEQKKTCGVSSVGRILTLSRRNATRR